MSDQLKSILVALKELGNRISAIEEQLGAGRSSSGKSVWELTKIIEAKEKKCKELKDSFCVEVAMGDQWSDESMRQQYGSIRRDIKELNHQLSEL